MLLLSKPDVMAHTKGTIVGKNEIDRWENLVGPFLVHKFFGPRPPSPLLIPLIPSIP